MTSAANVLAVIDEWPVGDAAAAVLDRSGVRATYGDVSAPFHLASVTKPLAALGVLIAVEEEALTLDDPFDDELAELLPGATVRHLLAHASGIAPEGRLRSAAAGTRRIYSNSGFDVLGELVSTATGIDFADYLTEALFEPLEMGTAALPGSPASTGLASVQDLLAVLNELMSPAGLLDVTSVSALSTVQFPRLAGVLPGYGRRENNDWGLGFEIRADKAPHWTGTTNSAATYGHFGRSGTMFWIDPVAQLALVALTDRPFDDWAKQVWPALSDNVLQAFAGTAPVGG